MLPKLARLLLVLFLAGCGRPAAAPPPDAGQADARGPVEVKTVRPEKKTLHRTVEQPGRVEAFEQAPLHVKIAGFVRQVHADIGDRVKKGAVLAELWVPEMEEELKQKQALVEQAQAEIEQAKGALSEAEAHIMSVLAKVTEVEAGRTRAQAELNRWNAQFQSEQELVRRNVLMQQSLEVTRNEVETAKAARAEVEAKVKSAQAAVDESKAKRDKAQADVDVVVARRKVAEAEQRRLEALLQYAKITAPFDGVVTRRNVDPGHFLQPAASSKGEPVFVVARTDPVRVFVDVPEADAVLIRDGAAARVRVQVLRGQEFAGKVTRSAWALDPRSRTLRTEVDLPNADGRLRPGMYAYASITLEYPDVLTLPASAVVIQGEQAYCFLVEDGKAVRTAVRVGARGAQAVEVLALQKRAPKAGGEVWQSFTGAERVVAGNLTGLADGQVVRAVE